MPEQLDTKYDPQRVEESWYQTWEKKGYFHAQPEEGKTPFCIVIPPPNVTGILHMGHALNNTIQDILIRYRRMKGCEALWMPGTDHAGIATQNVVEKSIAKEGLKRQDLGRDKFLEKVWQWRQEYGSTIIRQLKRLGSSCDWERIRFTMDPDYSVSVTEVFIRLYEKGLIYRGTYIINWCPRCQTALSDEEAPHQEIKGNLYYLKYPLDGQKASFITVATTRPETMLGDTAVAVNPKDKRYKKYVGKMLMLPLMNRAIPVIADPMVDMEFGTGAVKVTPAHDPNDYSMGKKHGLEFINILSPDGKLNKQAGAYAGMDRFKAREKVIEDLQQEGFLEKIEAHNLSAGHCYRCHTIIEPYLSKQWFVRMKPLSLPAIEAVKSGEIKFHPERWTKVYLNWMENIQDWCVSRQIWWGHRLPVYYCAKCEQDNPDKGVVVSRSNPVTCTACGGTLRQDEDVLDTWFSSWLWPFATFYWPFKDSQGKTKEDSSSAKYRKELEFFYPTSALVTAPEIIFFWVARMIMAGFEFIGKKPFSDVYIHGTVRDIEGKKMSKSLGNIIDPLDIIKEYGTDALRFSLISITAQGQDVFLSKERFEQGRNFANKIWNASRFILMNNTLTQISVPDPAKLNLLNRWIFSRFNGVLEQVENDINTFRFNEAANALYSFFWHEFCDWYLELVKPDIKEEQSQRVILSLLEKFLRMLHPFMPFISEEIWQKLPRQGDTIMLQEYPQAYATGIDPKAEGQMNLLFGVITTIRNMRQELEISPAALANVKICLQNAQKHDLLTAMTDTVKRMAKLAEFELFKHEYAHEKGRFVMVYEDMHIVMPLAGLVDQDKQVQKIENKLKSVQREIDSKKNTLANQDFLKRAPADIVGKEKEKLKELEETLIKLKGVRDGLR